jgi:DNA-binding response OmpR family regulator
MNGNVGKLLLVESDDALREHIITVLSDAGYEVSTEYGKE